MTELTGIDSKDHMLCFQCILFTWNEIWAVLGRYFIFLDSKNSLSKAYPFLPLSLLFYFLSFSFSYSVLECYHSGTPSLSISSPKLLSYKCFYLSLWCLQTKPKSAIYSKVPQTTPGFALTAPYALVQLLNSTSPPIYHIALFLFIPGTPLTLLNAQVPMPQSLPYSFLLSPLRSPLSSCFLHFRHVHPICKCLFAHPLHMSEPFHHTLVDSHYNTSL